MYIQLPNGNVFRIDSIAAIIAHDESSPPEYPNECPEYREHPAGVTVILNFNGASVVSEIARADFDAACSLREKLVEVCGLDVRRVGSHHPSQKNDSPD